MIFYVRPADFKPWFEVAACVYEYDGKILLLKRREDKSAGGLWGAVGGKVDLGETVSQALIREAREESGVSLQEADSVLAQTFYVRANAEKDIVYHLHRAVFNTLPEIRINPLEHTEYGWFTVEEALKLPLVHDMEECLRFVYKA